MKLKLSLILAVLLFISDFGLAKVELKSACFMDDDDAVVHWMGAEDDLLRPIASVSKVFTSFMALSKFQITDTPFSTQVFVWEAAPAKYNVHLRGGGDPQFNRFKMHRIISILNQMGITQVQLLTFDENVKFLYDTDTNDEYIVNGTKFKPIEIKAGIDFPSSDLVKTQLQNWWSLIKDYDNSVKTALQNSVQMVPTPKLKIADVQFLYSRYFKQDPQAKVFYVNSHPLLSILKSMNDKSNNFVANRLYSVAGGEDYFKQLFFINYKIVPDQLSFINGSGQNHSLFDEGRIYNQSSCSIVLRTLRGMNKLLISQKKDLSQVLSTIGVDEASNLNSRSFYSVAQTKGLLAKSGTIGTNVTLSGAIRVLKNEKPSYRYFMFNVDLDLPGVNATQEMIARRQSQGRQMIRDKLIELVLQTKKTFK